MFENEIKLLNAAYKNYALNNQYEIEIKLLDYIESRIIDEKDNIKELLKINNENITYDDIYNTFIKEKSNNFVYKNEKKYYKTLTNYAYGIYTTSIGNIVIETSNTLNILKYFIEAIKSHNTITISDIDYNELSVKSALFLIFDEAIAKYNIDSNLIMYVPYEECSYDCFDKIIYKDEFKNPKVKNKIDKYYIYMEDDTFEDTVKREESALINYNKKYEIIKGNMQDAIDKINNQVPYFASIYTSNHIKGYEFMNLVHAKNAFVNVSFVEAEDFEEIDSELYVKKKIAYPLKNAKDDIEFLKVEKNTNEYTNTETALVEIKNPWYKKIISVIKNFFKK